MSDDVTTPKPGACLYYEVGQGLPGLVVFRVSETDNTPPIPPGAIGTVLLWPDSKCPMQSMLGRWTETWALAWRGSGMTERMSDERFNRLVGKVEWAKGEFGEDLQGYELSPWPLLDEALTEARRARGAEIQGQIVGGMTVPEICDALRERDELRARVAELEEWIKSQLCTVCETGVWADGLFEKGRKP